MADAIASSDHPLVSVVMAVCAKDRLDFFQQALHSVQRQTYPALEILVSVDGPFDTLKQAFLDEQAALDPRIRVVSSPVNQGPAAARNLAFLAARGEYIAVADSDDICLPERIARQVAFMRETGADLAGTFMQYIDAEGKVTSEKQMPAGPGKVARALILFSPINNPTVMARRQVLLETPYDPRYRIAEDYDLFVRLARKGMRLDNLPEYLYRLRAREDFLSKRSGYVCFRNDLVVRLKAVPLYPWYMIPLTFLAAVGLSAMRLLPVRLLSWVYWLRARLRFHAAR